MQRVVQDISADQKRVIVRIDFNVPMISGEIMDDTRIKAAIPTILLLLKKGAFVVLVSHLGRPKGSYNTKYSLRAVAKRLQTLLNQEVEFIDYPFFNQIEKIYSSRSRVVLLENIRFYPEETKPTETFVHQLKSCADFYVNDAFATSHRKHSSTYFLAKEFEDKAFLGLLVQKEISQLSQLMQNYKRPFYGVIGGAKVSSKIGVLDQLLRQVDALFIGGAMAYTFLKAQGVEIGSSLFEQEFISYASSLLKRAKELNTPIYLPIDFIVSTGIEDHLNIQTRTQKEGILKNEMGLDIGPLTINLFQEKISSANTLFWNGPMGVFEQKPFAKGTYAIAQAISKISGQTVVGGGDSLSAIEQLNLSNQFTHLSTGGGAMLEWIEKGSLPCINIDLQKQSMTKSEI